MLKPRQLCWSHAHAADEIAEARVRVQGIEPGSPGEPEQGAIAEAVRRVEPRERRVEVAESGVDHREGERWGLD
jgi:hypothetical protein